MPVTLIGADAPKVVLTEPDGNFSFPNVLKGNYTLIAVQKELDRMAQKSVTIKENQDATDIQLKINVELPDSDTEGGRYVVLKYIQYIFLMIVGLIYFWMIGWGVRDLTVTKLMNLESARGVITYFVAVTTIAMAAMLMLAAIMTGGKDLDKRFALGKEILTLLIGVLGTIIGFYYGSTIKSTNETPSGIAVRDLRAIPDTSAIGTPFSVSATITGGSSPYVYSLTVKPTGTIEPILNKSSSDGHINEDISFLKSAKPGSATILLNGTDEKNTHFSANQVIVITK